MFKLLALLLVAAVYAAQAAPIETIKLRFKISARDLPDKDNVGKGDPYAEVYYTEDGKKDEIKIGKTATLTDQANPDWGDVFEFEFVRSKRQKWILKIYDHDNLREDDKLGLAYIEVADFVDKNQHLSQNLNKKGYVLLDTVDPVPVASTIPGQPGVVLQNTQVVPISHVAPGGQIVYSTTSPMKLKFKLSARDLPDKDKVGATDPYVDLYYTEGASTKQTKFGTTAVINDNNNPSWGEIFEFQYDPTRAQKWYFEIRDSDYGDTDGVGKVWVDVADYIAKGQTLTVNLSKKGTLTIQSIEPVVNPGVAGPVQQLQPVQPVLIHHPVQPLQPVLVQQVQPVVVQPVAPPAPTVQKLRFKLSAKGLEDRDVLGTSDPYVKVYFKHGSEKDVLIGNTKKYDDKENVDWPDVFEYNYSPSVNPNPKFHFLVLDDDNGRSDEELGDVYVDVAEYVQKGESLSVSLKKGSLTISKA